MTSRIDTARRLSNLARAVYDEAGCPGAYVRLRPRGYELHEPSPNAAPILYPTAAECASAIEDSRRSFAIDNA